MKPLFPEDLKMRNCPNKRAFTLVEVAVAIGVVFLILAAATPFFLRNRGKTHVNQAVEVTKALIERAGEVAKSSGYPLPEDFLQQGLATPAGTPVEGQPIIVRIRKRSNDQVTLISQRPLTGSEGINLALTGLGKLDLDSVTMQGIFVEIVQEEEGAETLLATIPVDVNGEFVFASGESGAAIHFRYGQHVRGIQMNIRGAVRSEQR